VATEVAERLANIPGCKGRAGALKGLVRLLQKLCQGGIDRAGRARTPEQQAYWLGDEAAEECPNWASEAQLKRMFQTQFPPKSRPGNALQDFVGAAADGTCLRCNNSGKTKSTVMLDAGLPDGSWRWCKCPAAQALQREDPTLIDHLNAEERERSATVKGVGPLRRPESLRYVGNRAVCITTTTRRKSKR